MNPLSDYDCFPRVECWYGIVGERTQTDGLLDRKFGGLGLGLGLL